MREIKINNVYTNIVMDEDERAEVLYIDYSIDNNRETYEIYFWTDGTIDAYSDFDTPKRTILKRLFKIILLTCEMDRLTLSSGGVK